jgi:hypothetical protein
MPVDRKTVSYASRPDAAIDIDRFFVQLSALSSQLSAKLP